MKPVGASDDRETTAPAPSDAQLLVLVAKSSKQAFEAIVGRYYPSVYRVVWRLTRGGMDTEDVVQEAFLKLWNNPGQIREAGALKGWLIRVASNLVMDRYRQKPMDELEQADAVADLRPTAEAELTRVQAESRVDQAVAQLPDRQKLALTLVYYEQMTNIAAAGIMEISVDAIESLLARARRSLKESLAGDRRELLDTLASERGL